jgi:hypothetical protein
MDAGPHRMQRPRAKAPRARSGNKPGRQPASHPHRQRLDCGRQRRLMVPMPGAEIVAAPPGPHRWNWQGHIPLRPGLGAEDGDAVEGVPTSSGGEVHGEGETWGRCRVSSGLPSKSVSEKCVVASCSSSSFVLRPRFSGEFRGRGTRTRTRREPKLQTRSKRRVVENTEGHPRPRFSVLQGSAQSGGSSGRTA